MPPRGREVQPLRARERRRVEGGIAARLGYLARLGDEPPRGIHEHSQHHVAFDVADIQGALDQLAAEGAELIDEEPRPGLYGMQVAFVHPESVHGVLVELVSNG